MIIQAIVIDGASEGITLRATAETARPPASCG